MTNITKNLHPNTIAFSCLEPEAATLIIDIILALASVLRWRHSSKYLLTEIISRLAELDFFECSHADLSSAMWPSLSDTARKEKFSKWLTRFKEDMKLSLCFAVEIAPPRHKKTEDGAYIGLPTLYKRGAFWGLFRAVQDEAIKCDLLHLGVRPRRIKVREIVAMWLERYGAKPIERVKKEKTEKSEKKAAEKSDCPSPCAHCSLKEKSAARIERLRKSPNEDFNARIEALVEYGYQGLCDVGEINADFRFKAKHVLHEVEMMITRAREMIVKNNKAGLKLVGGQQK